MLELALKCGLIIGPAGPVACAQSSPEQAPLTLPEGIVYTSLRPGNLDLYLFEEPPALPTRLTTHPALDYNPTFSPDGRWLVFTSERSGNPELWALELDEDRAPIRLTDHEALDDAADFSPDGKTLAFVSTRDGNADIFLMPFRPDQPEARDGAVNLTRRPGGDFNPAFSPDGRWIAYSRQDKLWPDLYPDRTAFDANGADLYVMAADGSDVRELVDQGPGPEVEPGIPFGSVAGSPVWAESSETIYYYRVSASGREIRQVDRDGSGDAPVAANGLSPALTPEGRVAFTRPATDRGLDAMDVLSTGRIVSVHLEDGSEQFESGPDGDFFAPDFDAHTGRMVAHGPGPVDESPGRMRNGVLFAPAGGQSRARLPDREVLTWAVRGFFPALTSEGEVVSTLLDDGTLCRTGLDGTDRRPFQLGDGIAWGAAIARDTNVMAVAVGPLFAPGTEEVDVWMVPLDGAAPENLTATISANDALPHLAAGGPIVFRSGGDGGVGRIFVMDRNGDRRRRLTSFDAAETMPAVSPDGEWVVFTTLRPRGWKLWIQRLDGSEGRFLEPDRIDVPDTSMHPRFSPDGRWVVFTSDRGGLNDEWPLTPAPQPYGDLYAVSVAEGVTVRLIHNKWEDGPNDWGPMSIPAAESAPGTSRE